MVGSANMTDRAGLGLPPWMRLPGKMVSWKTLKLSSLKAYSKLRVIGGSGKSRAGFPHSLEFAGPWCSVSISSHGAVMGTQGFSRKSLLTGENNRVQVKLQATGACICLHACDARAGSEFSSLPHRHS